MIDHNPSSGLSDLHRYLIASPTQRHIVWLGEGVPYVPDTLPNSALIISTESAESIETAPGHEVLQREGELDADCEQLIIDNAFEISVMSYTLSAYLPCVGPVLVRLSSEEDWQAFLTDADDAVATGFVPDQLLHLPAVLEDSEALRTGTPNTNRLTITTEGTTRHLPGTDLSPTRRDTGGRYWLPRYLTILNVLRSLSLKEPGPVEVSGLGMRLSDSSPDSLVEPPDAPIVLRSPSGLRCVCPDSGRFFALPESAATAIELIGALGANAEELPDLLHVPSAMASQTVAALVDQRLVSPEVVYHG